MYANGYIRIHVYIYIYIEGERGREREKRERERERERKSWAAVPRLFRGCIIFIALVSLVASSLRLSISCCVWVLVYQRQWLAVHCSKGSESCSGNVNPKLQTLINPNKP